MLLAGTKSSRRGKRRDQISADADDECRDSADENVLAARADADACGVRLQDSPVSVRVGDAHRVCACAHGSLAREHGGARDFLLCVATLRLPLMHLRLISQR